MIYNLQFVLLSVHFQALQITKIRILRNDYFKVTYYSFFFFSTVSLNHSSSGTCTLHSLHNGYSKILEALDTKLEKVLMCLHSWFKHSTGWREDYVKVVKLFVEILLSFQSRVVPKRWVESLAALLKLKTQWKPLKVIKISHDKAFP